MFLRPRAGCICSRFASPPRLAKLHNRRSPPENFNSLPTDINSTNSIESIYTDGWQDDVDYAISPQDDISIPGWYLYHPTTQSEGGFNDHQRFRISNGGNTTGSFYGYFPPPFNLQNPERALGMLPTDEIVPRGQAMVMALRITNVSGQLLKNFQLRFQGEQYRDGLGDPNAADKLLFSYSTTATPSDLLNESLFTPMPAFDFTASVVGNTNGAVNGDLEITGIEGGVNLLWQPGADLWLRWSYINNDLLNDGLAIDNLRFAASVPEPASFLVAVLAMLSNATMRRAY